MKKIEIDDEVYKALLGLAESFENKPNDILRRIPGINKISFVDEKEETALEEMRKIVGIKDIWEISESGKKYVEKAHDKT